MLFLLADALPDDVAALFQLSSKKLIVLICIPTMIKNIKSSKSSFPERSERKKKLTDDSSRVKTGKRMYNIKM